MKTEWIMKLDVSKRSILDTIQNSYINSVASLIGPDITGTIIWKWLWSWPFDGSVLLDKWLHRVVFRVLARLNKQGVPPCVKNWGGGILLELPMRTTTWEHMIAAKRPRESGYIMPSSKHRQLTQSGQRTFLLLFTLKERECFVDSVRNGEGEFATATVHG